MRSGFDWVSGNVQFMGDRMGMGQEYLLVLFFFPAICIPQMFHTFIYGLSTLYNLGH